MDDLLEKNYSNYMEHEVADYLLPRMNSDYFERLPRQQLYYEDYRADDPKGVIVICHGLCENAEKYKELIYYFVLNHYHVFFLEHRGHGRSFRQVTDLCMIHVEHFKDYIEDLHGFICSVIKPASCGLPLYLYGHSMGGAIAAEYLELYPHTFQKAILSSPMLSIQTGRFSKAAALALSGFMRLSGRKRSFAYGQKPYHSGESFETSCSTSEPRFDYYNTKRESTPLFQNSGFSYGWLYESLKADRRITSKKQCRRIDIPIVIFAAEQDSLVCMDGIERFAKYTKQTRVILIPGTKHEIYRSSASVLRPYLQQIFEIFTD